MSGVYVLFELYIQLDLPQPIKITYVRKLILSFVNTIYVSINTNKRSCSMLDCLLIIDLCMLRTTHGGTNKRAVNEENKIISRVN